MSVIEKLLKRRCRPVKLGAETVHIRALTMRESLALGELPDEKKSLYAVGRALCDPAGADEFPFISGETTDEYATRMSVELADMGQDTMAEIMDAVLKVVKVPSAGAISKN